MPTLSEAASKAMLADLGIPVPKEAVVDTAVAAGEAAAALGFPVVAKLCGDAIAHKTERGLVRLGLLSVAEVEAAAQELLSAAGPDDGPVQVLVAEMVRGRRELIAGIVTDDAFGPCVMLGLGGILAEAIEDVVFRIAPLTLTDADEMINELQTQKLLGSFRGEPEVDRHSLAQTLVQLGTFAIDHPEVISVDLNPLIVVDGLPVAVDALVEVRS